MGVKSAPDSIRATGPALEAMVRFLVWLVPAVEGFPRSQKFTLGDRIQSTALDVLERPIEATTYSRTFTYRRREQVAFCASRSSDTGDRDESLISSPSKSAGALCAVVETHSLH